MKIYTYLGAGKAIVATNIRSHTQVLSARNACLVEPQPAEMAKGIRKLLASPETMAAIAGRALEDAQQQYSYSQFKQRLSDFYQLIVK